MHSVSYIGFFPKFCSSVNTEINQWDPGAYTCLVSVRVFPFEFQLQCALYP